MKNILLIALVILGIAMIYLGVSTGIIPPTFTGIGFIIIAIVLYQKNN